MFYENFELMEAIALNCTGGDKLILNHADIATCSANDEVFGNVYATTGICEEIVDGEWPGMEFAVANSQ